MNNSRNETGGLTTTIWTYTALEAMLMIAICLGNSLVILAYYRSTQLKTITNYFIMNLACSDMIVGLFMPLHIAMFIYPTMLKNEHVCILRYVTLQYPMMTSMFCLAAITYDRYNHIVKSVHYVSFMSRRRTILTILVVWCLPVVPGVIVQYMWHNDFTDETSCDFLITQPRELIGFIILPIYVIPLIAIICMYMKIFAIARRHMKAIQSQQKAGTMNAEQASKENSAISSELVLTKTAFIVLGTFLLCWVPLISMTGIQVYGNLTRNRTLSQIRGYCTILAIVNSSINPVIYSFRMKEFRQEFRKILHLRNVTQEYSTCEMNPLPIHTSR